MYDIAIIGAGPAGATLARLIGKTYRVLLIDKRPFTDTSDSLYQGKCCGGLLAPDAQKMLSKLGLGLPRSVLEDPQVFVVKAMDLQRGIARYYQRHYINMNRERFDRWLISLIPAGVDIRTSCRFKSYSHTNGHFDLTLAHNGKTFTECARILVGADGAISKLRRPGSNQQPFPQRYFAIQEWVEVRHATPYFTSLFDPEITDYYCWTIPKNDHLIIGAALQPQNKLAEKFVLLKHKLRQCGFEFGRTVLKEGTYVLRPVKINQLSTGTNGIALIGEAAGWISPSSAEGLSYAFKSALMLAQALRKSPEGFEKRYYDNTQALRRTLWLKTVKAQFIFRPILRAAVMGSGIQSINVDQGD